MGNKNIFQLVILLALSFITCCNKKKSNGDTATGESIRIVKQGLQHVWEILWGPDDHIWFTEREGKISKMNPTTGAIVFSATINEVASSGEGGLLGLALHPDFPVNGFLYIVYNYNSPNGYREKLVRYTFSNNAITNPTTLIENIAASGIHNGSRIRIVRRQHPRASAYIPNPKTMIKSGHNMLECMAGLSNRSRLAGWCNVYHQFTDHLIIGILINPIIKKMEATKVASMTNCVPITPHYTSGRKRLCR